MFCNGFPATSWRLLSTCPVTVTFGCYENLWSPFSSQLDTQLVSRWSVISLIQSPGSSDVERFGYQSSITVEQMYSDQTSNRCFNLIIKYKRINKITIPGVVQRERIYINKYNINKIRTKNVKRIGTVKYYII